MKKIKIDFVDFWEIDKQNNAVVNILKKRYDVEISKTPDYIFCSVFGNSHLKYKNCVKILVLGENMAPDFNLYDYAIGFYDISYDDRYLKHNILLEEEIVRRVENRVEQYKTKEKFCAFVYGKNLFNAKRVEIFNKLSEYKKVDSGGKFLNNIGKRIGSKKIDKINFQSDYKFIIACENQQFPEYNTEKLLEAFASGGIPIYWGDPKIGEVYNKEAFINCDDFKNLEDLKQKIIELDNDDEKYLEMLNKKAFNEEYCFDSEQKKLENFLFNIFDKKTEEARKVRLRKEFYTYKYYKIYFPTAILYDIFLKTKIKIRKWKSKG